MTNNIIKHLAASVHRKNHPSYVQNRHFQAIFVHFVFQTAFFYVSVAILHRITETSTLKQIPPSSPLWEVLFCPPDGVNGKIGHAFSLSPSSRQ
jgi:hypothetical protein